MSGRGRGTSGRSSIQCTAPYSSINRKGTCVSDGRDVAVPFISDPEHHRSHYHREIWSETIQPLIRRVKHIHTKIEKGFRKFISQPLNCRVCVASKLLLHPVVPPSPENIFLVKNVSLFVNSTDWLTT